MVSNTSAMFREILDTKWIQTNDGAKVTIEDPKPQFYVMATVVKDGEMTSSYEAEGVTGGMDDLFYRKTPEQIAEKAVKLAVDKLTAPHIVGGTYTVVLHPALVGILSHEAIGHTVEADFVLQGSIAAQKMGQKVGSELITLKDAGTNTMNVGHPSGDIGIDDEGVETQDVGIIVDGVMRSYLHNRETAAHFGVKPTGNARAWGYTDIPIIRMRNTYIMSGNKTPEEIISSTKDGLYIVSPGSGQADANAEFMFGCEEIYEIKNGKVGKLLKNATISGDAFEVLKSVDMVGNDFTWAMGSGYCGKGQPAAVDGGGPTLRCKAMIGGQAMNILDIAGQTVADISKKHKAEAEVCISQSHEIKVTIQNNRLHVVSSDTSTWAGVRVIKSKAVGFASVNDLAKIDDVCDESVAIAKSSPKNEANVLPEMTTLSSVSGLYDARISNLELDQAMKLSQQLIDAVLAVDKRISIEGEFSISSGKSAIANSNGISSQSKGTGIVYFLMGQAVGRVNRWLF